MKIYTKTGDDGETGLYGGGRVSKDDARIEAYGTVDELNALLGLARTEPLPAQIDQLLRQIQNELFDVGAELATRDPTARLATTLGDRQIGALEKSIDDFEATLAPLRQFILPGGTSSAAALHLARTVCRRAERRVVSLAAVPNEHVSTALVVYLNRLSDLLFVLARATNHAAGVPDIPWQKSV